MDPALRLLRWSAMAFVRKKVCSSTMSSVSLSVTFNLLFSWCSSFNHLACSPLFVIVRIYTASPVLHPVYNSVLKIFSILGLLLHFCNTKSAIFFLLFFRTEYISQAYTKSSSFYLLSASVVLGSLWKLWACETK
jgi:hypothetical protein